MIGGRKAAIAGAAAVVVTASAIGMAAAANGDEGKVIRVIDGDTLVVDFDNQELTVRLLNVDTPETKDPDKPVECLGPEATDFLTEALPAGSTVTLAFDVEREDRYGRTLAAVYDDDGLLINAEVARRGLGIPVTYEPNAKFRPPVDEAYNEARNSGAGLFDSEVECTVPAAVQALEDTAAQAALEETGSSAASAAAAAAGVLVLAKLVDEGFDVLEAGSREGASMIWAAFSETEKAAWKARALTAKDSVHTHHGELVSLQEARQANEDEVKRQAAEAKAEAERLAAEEEARKVAAAAQAEAERLAAEARRLEAAQAEANRQAYVPPAPQYVAPAPSNPYPGYNGPRCYAPGGKTWSPC